MAPSKRPNSRGNVAVIRRATCCARRPRGGELNFTPSHGRSKQQRGRFRSPRPCAVADNHPFPPPPLSPCVKAPTPHVEARVAAIR